MQIVSEQVTQEIHRSLKNMGLAPLSSDNSVSLVGQLQNIAKKENCVRSVIGERAHVWAARVLGGGQPWSGCISGPRAEAFPVRWKGLKEACNRSPVHPTWLKSLRAVESLIGTSTPALQQEISWVGLRHLCSTDPVP